jgi:hypothetical protein
MAASVLPSDFYIEGMQLSVGNTTGGVTTMTRTIGVGEFPKAKDIGPLTALLDNVRQ